MTSQPDEYYYPGSFIREMRYRDLLPFLFAVLCVGCEPGHPAVAPLAGKVLIDGRPLKTGMVNTLPTAGRGARGEIQSDGSFRLHTYGKNDGALVGSHKVSVVAYEGVAAKTPESPYGKLLVPRHYTNPETSELKIDVPSSGADDVLLELSSKEQPKK